MSENGNELAHPVAKQSFPARDGDYTVHEVTGGLTKREAFALAAMQGYCAREGSIECDADSIALDAVRLADALLAELEQQP